MTGYDHLPCGRVIFLHVVIISFYLFYYVCRPVYIGGILIHSIVERYFWTQMGSFERCGGGGRNGRFECNGMIGILNV